MERRNLISNIMNIKFNRKFNLCRKIKILNFNRIFAKGSIKNKIQKSFIIILIISNIASIMGLIFLLKTNSKYKNTLINYGFAQGEVGNLGMEIEKTFSTIRDMTTSKSTEEYNLEETRLKKSMQVINEILATLEDKCIVGDERKIVNDIKESLDKYNNIINEVIDLSEKEKKEDALYIFKAKGIVASNSITSNINNLMNVKVQEGEKLSSQLIKLEVISLVIITLILVITIFLTIKLSKHLSNGISSSIREVADISKKIAAGNLDIHIEVNSEDEIGELETAFCEMVLVIKGYIEDLSKVLSNIEKGNFNVTTEKDYVGNFTEMKTSIDNILKSLNIVFKDIGLVANTVNIGAKKLSVRSQDLATGATNQSNAVINISNTSKAINEQVDINAKNSNVANHISNKFVEVVEKSNEEMQNMIRSMEEIQISSQNISDIIKDIDNIADQTNLLALNAAIEAARAGEAGNGFAIVAEEVRNLSNMSAKAAKKTSALIKESIESINLGKQIANNTAGNLFEVVNKVKESNSLINKITSASNEQSEAIGDMSEEVEHISEIIQSNSTIAEENAAASVELMEESKKLIAMIKRFEFKA